MVLFFVKHRFSGAFVLPVTTNVMVSSVRQSVSTTLSVGIISIYSGVGLRKSVHKQRLVGS